MNQEITITARLGKDKTPSLAHEMYLAYKQKQRDKRYHMGTILGFGVFMLIWSWVGTAFNLRAILMSMKSMVQFFIEDLLPPDFTILKSAFSPIMDTVYMSIVGVFIAVLLSLGLAILASKATTPHVLVGQMATALISFIRAIPSIILGIFIVAAFGLGVFAGALALGLAGVGMLGKAYIAALDELDQRQIEGLKSVGATWFQIIGQGVMPQFMPTFIAWTLFQIDLNIRDSAILGMIGAGGIGLLLMNRIKVFQYQQASAVILAIFALIVVVELITSKIREKLL